eukprot:NODE_7169_length_1602_cov_5.592542.p1 GENE.NODE_7169_length_1602_cov_5.592542~~NODE_7169_length_1602_cov_5.592542.p1  ORF type:complete len:256 (+),score=89.79 NODE_7169_length_1602_cov_5.592542:592-1359(+)
MELFAMRTTFLKLAGGAKRKLLERAADVAPPGIVVELGTYVGYSAMVLAARPEPRNVVSIELDPVCALVARSTVEMAELSSHVDVWVGGSEDAARYVRDRFGPASVAMLFMDHRGSLFHGDLLAFEQLGLLADGARVVADNVLKPGAPRLLWHLRHNDAFEMDLVAVPEFGLGHACLEDWVAVCLYRAGMAHAPPPPPPKAIVDLARDADAMRRRSLHGDVTISAWAEHAAAAKAQLLKIGISTTGQLTASGDII